MKMPKRLAIRGTLLDRNQLCQYVEKIADEHTIKTNSDENTFPIQVMHNDFAFIVETYRLLNKHIKLGIKIHSAGEWLLDNFYIIEETVKSIDKELNLKLYKSLPGLSNGRYKGFARIYVLAEEIVAYTDCKIDKEVIDLALKFYQNKKFLSIDEICNIGIFLKIAIISHIKDVCEKIYSSQIQKYKVESIIERIIESKSIDEQKFTEHANVKIFSDTQMKYPFIEYMSYKLKLHGKNAVEYQNVLEKEVQKLGISVSDVIRKEHSYIANLKIKIGNCITSIRTINRISFAELFGEINISEEILRKDPTGEYELMDQESKSYYRGIITEISKKSKISEIYICEKIIELCERYSEFKNLDEKKKAHVGYYLICDGKNELENELEIKHGKKRNFQFKSKLYIASNIIWPVYFDFAINLFIYNKYENWWIFLINLIIMYIPISEIFIRILNYIMGKCKKPIMIPKLNFENGIPDDKKTFVVVPTILKSKEKVKEMIDKLEVYYLANKTQNLYFALLGDCSEEKTEKTNFDEEIIEFGKKYIDDLNQKYEYSNFNKFHFLYRKRVWSESEKTYIGWERKRGLLATFNKYIKGKMENNFLINTIEEQKDFLPDIKYIITLDSDTNLCLQSAQKLVGAMSHTLNQPIIKNRKVIDGYGIMQPRVGVDLELTKKTKFIEIYSVHGGIDFYTNTISDIYQDYFGEGIFTGKGIYDVDAYNEILDGEIPESTVLSHDLLEGNFLRCGLITDCMLLDGFPLKYLAYIMRDHRWVRGDWQIARWLKSKRLNQLSKFKIYDNLRRSLVPVVSLFGIIIGILCNYVLENSGNVLICLSLSSVIITFIIDILNYVIFKESIIYGSVYTNKKFSNDMKNSEITESRIFLSLIFLPYEAYKNLDSIIRAIYRIKHKSKMLEWVTAEEGEKKSGNNLKSFFNEMKISVILGLIFLFSKNIFFTILRNILDNIADYCVEYKQRKY